VHVKNQDGYTLIEQVIGIIVFSIALGLFTSLLVPQVVRSVEPVFQVRASELGQSLINEIVSKSYDEESDRVGGAVLCDDSSCTAWENMGADPMDSGTESRINFDDVDDYNGFEMPNIHGVFNNALGEALTINGANLYESFTVNVSVFYDTDFDGINDEAIGSAKLITITITTPNDESIIFSTYVSNY
jgi:MSHA pilin protein MshD